MSANRLQKYGRPNEKTPAKWNAEYQDFNAPSDPSATNGVSAPFGTSETTRREDVLSAPPVAPTGEVVDTDAGVSAVPEVNGDEKKRKKHEGETPEERAERKRRKKEKKEKRESKKRSKDDSDDSD